MNCPDIISLLPKNVRNDFHYFLKKEKVKEGEGSEFTQRGSKM